jgi:hypothetical protein
MKVTLNSSRKFFRPSLEGLETRTTPASLGGLTSLAPPQQVPMVRMMAPPQAANALSLNQKILNFARANIGNTVRLDQGGDCYDFVAEAVRRSGGRVNTHQGAGTINGQTHYIWGDRVYQKSKLAGWSNTGSLANIKPGDCIQFDGCKFVNGGSWQKTSHHSAIVESVNTRTGVIKVIHQNIGGVKKVFRGEYNVNQMTTGVMTIYRPRSA